MTDHGHLESHETGPLWRTVLVVTAMTLGSLLLGAGLTYGLLLFGPL